jgi:hypothetical protein
MIYNMSIEVINTMFPASVIFGPIKDNNKEFRYNIEILSKNVIRKF